jgi:hypothetical protein
MRVYWTTGKPTLSFIPFLKKRVAKKALEVATTIWEIAVDLTPASSGELRASWNLSQGQPNFSTVGPSDSSPGTGPSIPKPTKPVIPEVELRDAIFYITNGKAYAGHVEYGSNTIPPHLMLTRALQITGKL